MHVLATAGHVDHGKSTLVRALTGTDPDRWQEEKARGLTIDLGFARLVLDSGREVAFVDVPGHVRFLRNMLAGVGAVDGCLLVVAATEGWKQQSEEHLRILDILGIGTGLIVITNADRVDATRLADVVDQARDRVSGTFLAGGRVVVTDSVSGTGLGELKDAIDALLGVTPTAVDRGRPRLWVDRSFAVRGVGTVVTGTLGGGTVALDDALVAVGPGPLGAMGPPWDRAVRVRGLQTHGTSAASVAPGARVAVNLVGAAHRDLVRGDALVCPGQWHPTRVVDASLLPLPALDHPVSRRGAYALYAGTGAHAVRLRVIGPPEIAPGEEGLVRLYLPAAVALLPGDRYVLREAGRAETVGGGTILDIDPVLRLSSAAPSTSVDRVIAERAWTTVELLEQLTGERRPGNVAGRWVVDARILDREVTELSALVAAGGPDGVEVAGLDDHQRALLDRLDGVTVMAGRARPAGAPAPSSGSPWLAALTAQPWTPPDPWTAGASRLEVREAVRLGEVVERDGVYFAVSAVEEAATVIAGLLVVAPGGVTVAEVRDALGSSRKHVLPLLKHLDATGMTRRRGDVRVAGPRLPPPNRR